MKKIISIIISIAVLLLLIVGIFVVWGDVFTNKKNDKENIGECYFYQTDSEHITLDNSGIKYANNEILVVSKDKVRKKDVENLAKKYNAEIVGYIEQTDDFQWKLKESYTIDELKEISDKIKLENIIDSVSLNYISEVSESNLPVQYGKEWSNEIWDENKINGKNWGLKSIQAISAWEILDRYKEKIKPIRLGLIDDGFDTGHEDLKFGETFYNVSSGNHGTHVAGTMAARSDNSIGICGVYPYGNGNLYGISSGGIHSYSENGTYDTSSMYQKIAFAELILRNVKVINISQNNRRNRVNQIVNKEKNWEEALNELNENSSIIGDFLNRLIKKKYDFVIVSAAGNSSDKTTGHLESEYNSFINAINKDKYPNVYNRIIVVGSIGIESKSSNYYISEFSNAGERLDIYAPGEEILSTIPGNKYQSKNYSGTSMAAPHVSGVAAMVWSANNGLTGAEVKEIICSTAKCPEKSGSEYFKLVNAKSALEKALGIETIETTEKSENGGILNYVVEKDNEDVKIKNAQVVAVGTDGTEYKTITDEQGHFELILPEGVYTLTITKDEYEPYTWKNIEVKNEGVNYLSDWTKLEKIQNYTWHLAPTIEAEDIIVSDEYSNNNTDSMIDPYDECAIIQQNGKYGIIKYNGSYIAESKYNKYFCDGVYELAVFNADEFGKNNGENVFVFPDENELKIYEPFEGGRGNIQLTYIYDNNKNSVYSVLENFEFSKYTENSCILVENYDFKITLEYDELNNTYKDKEFHKKIESATLKYGIAKNGKIIIPCEYEDGCMNFSNGVVTLKKDNKWGFFDENGKQIIDFICEPFETKILYGGWCKNTKNSTEYPFLSSGGYIPVKIEGKCGYYDIYGNEIIPCGTFEEVRPVHNGLAWVKKDGKWGVIKLKNIEIESNTKPTDLTVNVNSIYIGEITKDNCTHYYTMNINEDCSLFIVNTTNSDGIKGGFDLPIEKNENGVYFYTNGSCYDRNQITGGRMHVIDGLIGTITVMSDGALLWKTEDSLPYELILKPQNVETKEPLFIGTVNTKKDPLNVRKLPSTEAEIIGKIYKGSTVTVNSESGDWYEIEYNGGVGYVSKEYIKVNGSTSNEQTSSISDDKILKAINKYLEENKGHLGTWFTVSDAPYCPVEHMYSTDKKWSCPINLSWEQYSAHEIAGAYPYFAYVDKSTLKCTLTANYETVVEFDLNDYIQ